MFLCVLALVPLGGMANECGESRKLLDTGTGGPLDLLTYAREEGLPEHLVQALEPRIATLNLDRNKAKDFILFLKGLKENNQLTAVNSMEEFLWEGRATSRQARRFHRIRKAIARRSDDDGAFRSLRFQCASQRANVAMGQAQAGFATGLFVGFLTSVEVGLLFGSEQERDPLGNLLQGASMGLKGTLPGTKAVVSRFQGLGNSHCWGRP